MAKKIDIDPIGGRGRVPAIIATPEKERNQGLIPSGRVAFLPRVHYGDGRAVFLLLVGTHLEPLAREIARRNPLAKRTQKALTALFRKRARTGNSRIWAAIRAGHIRPVEELAAVFSEGAAILSDFAAHYARRDERAAQRMTLVAARMAKKAKKIEAKLASSSEDASKQPRAKKPRGGGKKDEDFSW